MTASHPSTELSSELKAPTAKLDAGATANECIVKVGGDWQLSEGVPSWNSVFGSHAAASVRVVPDDLGKWDTSLLLFLVHGRAWCLESKHDFNAEALPENLQTLLRQVAKSDAPKPAVKPAAKSNWALAQTLVKKWAGLATENISFIGECTLGLISIIKNPRRFRWMDCVVEMQHCWSSSLPIVSLVSFLVGVILAFQAAIQLQQYGAAVFVADLVGLSVVREMGPMMAAVSEGAFRRHEAARRPGPRLGQRAGNSMHG